jgi:hypothetical protein
MALLVPALVQGERSHPGDRVGEFKESDVMGTNFPPLGMHDRPSNVVGAAPDEDRGASEVDPRRYVPGGKDPPVGDERAISRASDLGDCRELGPKGQIEGIGSVIPDDDGPGRGHSPGTGRQQTQEAPEARSNSEHDELFLEVGYRQDA